MHYSCLAAAFLTRPPRLAHKRCFACICNTANLESILAVRTAADTCAGLVAWSAEDHFEPSQVVQLAAAAVAALFKCSRTVTPHTGKWQDTMSGTAQVNFLVLL